MVVQSANAEAAYLWNKIGALWPFFIALLFQFILIFSNNPLSTDKRRFLILYLPAALFSLLDLLTDSISGPPVNTPWGYTFDGVQSPLSVASDMWATALSVLAVILCVRFYFKTTDENKRQQAKLISIGLVYPIILNVLSKASTPILGYHVPYYGVGANSILCVFIAYAIWRYDLFNINPAIAAENIIAAMPDSFILTDAKGKILRVNPALTDLIGYREDELVGRQIHELLKEKHTEFINDLANQQEIKGYETNIITKDNRQKPISISISLIKNKEGKRLGVTLIIHDLTRRKVNEEKILKNERFAAIGELAGMIGHDLRNPLNSMQAATYYIKKKSGKNLDITSKQMLDTIERSIEYSNKIVNDLLDYSREINLDLEDLSAKSLTQDALAIVEVPQNIEVINHIKETPTIPVDKVNISRVFVNIIKNAFEAMPQGGILTITSTQTQDTLKISFADTGTGMSQEIIDKLWRPLFTTKARGMGFGLPICKRIVDAHGGQIHVKSTLGEGTVFTLSLPFNNPKKVLVGFEIDLLPKIWENTQSTRSQTS